MSGLLSHLSIRSKLIVVFALVLCGTVGLGLFAVQRLDGVNGAAADLRDNWLPATRALGDMGRFAERVRVRQALQADATAENRSSNADSMKDQVKLFEDSFKKYLATIDLDPPDIIVEERGLADTMTNTWKAYKVLSDRYQDFFDHGAHEQAVAFSFHELSDGMNAFRQSINADLDFQIREGKKAGDRGAALGSSARTLILAVLAAMAMLCIGAGWSLVRGISTPIGKMSIAMRRLSERDMSSEIPGIGRGDEIGGMAAAVQVFKESMIRVDKLAGEQEEMKIATAAAQKAALNKTADAFEATVGKLVGMLSSGATELQATAQSMSSTATQTNQQASTVAAAAEEASAGVQTVAAAAEELTSSIREITRQVAQSAVISNKAVSDTRRTDSIVRALAESAQKIGQVVDLISNIAGQTNLLALNATIEAARAGDAGKGFAVVASEVKNLATQTAKATSEIAAQIKQIQSATTTIEEVSTIATTIASAVEEQGAATAEISRNVQQTAASTQEVTTNITGVSQAANDTGAAASQVLGAAGDLSKQAEQLTAEVHSFLAGVRAA
jgi:methyl-accepting chemotaxis protein